MNHFQELVEQEKARREARANSSIYVPEFLAKHLKQEVEKCRDEMEALETFKRLCPAKYRSRFKIESFRRGGVGSSYDQITLRERKKPVSRKKILAELRSLWLHKGEYYEYAKEHRISERVLEDLIVDWKAEEIKDRQESIRADQEALERVIRMKMEGISNCIDKLIESIERGISVMPDEAYSPKAIQALVSAAEGLQKMRNLEEGRPTSITGATKLTPKNIRERLQKLQRAGVAIEIDPALLEDADSDNPQ